MFQFIIASIKEILYEVTWPSYKELSNFFSLFFAALVVTTTLVGFINVYLQKIITALYGMF